MLGKRGLSDVEIYFSKMFRNFSSESLKNKRGLSDVVTTVLIILVALGAIGIIVGFLMPMIKQGSSQITSACMTLQLEPTKCTYNSTTQETHVLIKRNTGDAELKEIKVILYADTGETETKTMTSVPGILETKLLSTTTSLIPKEVKVAGVVITEAEDEKICGESVVESCQTVE